MTQENPFVDGFRLIDGTELNKQYANPVWSFSGPLSARTGGNVNNSPGLYDTITTITSAVGLNAGVALPQALPGMVKIVYNNTASTVVIFAQDGSTVDGVPGSIGIPLVGMAAAMYIATDVNEWQSASLILDQINVLDTVHTNLKNLPVSPSTNYIVFGYYSVGDGGGGFYYASSLQAPGYYVDNGGTIIVPAGGDGSLAWLRAPDPGAELDAACFGAKADGVTDASTALTNAAAVAPTFDNTVMVHETTTAPNTFIRNLLNTTFHGVIGALTNVYRKNAIPQSSPSDSFGANDIVPAKHLRAFNKAPIPQVCLVGDSLSTYAASILARGDALSNNLQRVLNDQCPNGVNFLNMAIGGADYATTLFNVYSPDIQWYQGYAADIWLDVVKAQSPDLVVFAFGMNSSPNMSPRKVNEVIKSVQGQWFGPQNWTKIPSIVMATNLIPAPDAGAPGKESLERRERAAHFVRTYAKYFNVGLLDFNRQANRARDGFDPFSNIIHQGGTVLPVAGVCTATSETYDYRAAVTFDPTALNAPNTWIRFKTGYGALDYIQISRVGPTALGWSMSSGNDATDDFSVDTGTFAYTWLGVQTTLVFERIGDTINLYEQVGVAEEPYLAPIFFMNYVALGGLYTPTVTMQPDTGIVSTEFRLSVPRVNTPSITNDLLFGPPTTVGIAYYGGDGGVHPGGFSASHVYRPVLENVQWYQSDNITGSFTIAAGDTGKVVLFTANQVQVDANYTILVSFEESDTVFPPGVPIFQNWWLASKGTGGFTFSLSFVPPAVNAPQPFKVKWVLVRD